MYRTCVLQVTRQVFEASKGRLKVVGRAGVGVDNVDLAAATEVRCCAVPDAAPFTSEMCPLCDNCNGYGIT